MKLQHGAFILGRYSTDNQDQDSIEVQVEKCSAWCREHGIPILDIFADYAISGMKDARPQFNRMMDLLNQGKADTVVILDQSRMFRKMTAWFKFRDDLENLGVRVVSVTQPMVGGDLRDPSNFLAEGSMALFNQMWVLQTRQKVVEKMRYMAKNGIHTGGLPPLGYKVEDRRLAIDPTEAHTVQRIFQLYADGWSYRKIVDLLNAEGIRTKRGNAFGANSIHDMLKNKKYIGTLVYGRVTQLPNGKRNNHRRSPDVIELEDACPAIIDKPLWDAVQKKIEANQRTGGRTPIVEDFHLRGKVFCGECGAPMNIHYSNSGRKFVYYICSAQKRTHVCTCKSVRAHWLEDTIAKAIRDAIGTPEDRGQLLDILRSQRQTVMEGAGGQMAALTARRKDITAQLENATDALLHGLTGQMMIGKIQRLENEKASLDYQIEQLHQDVTHATISEADMAAALDRIVSGQDLQNEALLSIVYRVEVSTDAIRVWTILDCAPDGKKRKKIQLKPEDLPEPPAPDSCVPLFENPRLHQTVQIRTLWVRILRIPLRHVKQP